MHVLSRGLDAPASKLLRRVTHSIKLITSDTIVGTVICANEKRTQGITGANSVMPNADNIALNNGCLALLALSESLLVPGQTADVSDLQMLLPLRKA